MIRNDPVEQRRDPQQVKVRRVVVAEWLRERRPSNIGDVAVPTDDESMQIAGSVIQERVSVQREYADISDQFRGFVKEYVSP